MSSHRNNIGAEILTCLEKGAILRGGFVRDWLIRGEKFTDIDFELFSEPDEYFKSWEDHPAAWASSYFIKAKVVDGMWFDVIRKPVNNELCELSCNIFGFDGNRLVLLPFPTKFCPKKSWEMILEKKFTRLFDRAAPDAVGKIAEKKWKFVYSKPEIGPLTDINMVGPWTHFTEAKRRFDETVR